MPLGLFERLTDFSLSNPSDTYLHECKVLSKIKVYNNGNSNDEAATKAIIWFNLINGFFTRSSPHKPQIKLPFEDFF